MLSANVYARFFFSYDIGDWGVGTGRWAFFFLFDFLVPPWGLVRIWDAGFVGFSLLVCKQSWDSTGGSRRDFVVGCPLLLLCPLVGLNLTGGLCLILLFGLNLIVLDGHARPHSRFSVLLAACGG